jgi:hypothetical protein
MRKNLVFLSLLLCAVACWGTPTPQYETYTTYSVDDNGNLSQTVVVDGTTTGDCYYTCNCGQYGCQQCTLANCPANHTPEINNVVNGVGGWSYGPQAGMFSYISYQTTTTIAATPGQEYLSSIEGAVFCAGVAAFTFDISSNTYISWALTKSQTDFSDYRTNQPVSGDAIECWVYSWCTDATTPPRCNPNYVYQFTAQRSNCAPYYTSSWLAVRTSLSAPYTCIGIIPIDNAKPTLDSTKLVCTK